MVLADNSQSLLIRDDGAPATRGDWVRDRLGRSRPGRPGSGRTSTSAATPSTRTSAPSTGFDALAFDGTGSSLATSLSALSRRFRGLPLAGVLLFTDGNRTDAGRPRLVAAAADLSRGAPRRGASPATSACATSRSARPTSSRPRSSSGPTSRPSASRASRSSPSSPTRPARRSSARRRRPTGDGKPLELPVPVPARAARASASTRSAPSPPRTRSKAEGRGRRRRPPASRPSANNSRLVVVDQGGGPYRVLYVSGRPNWEFKFLRRALDDDEQVQLVGLLRIARRQPKFDFQAPGQPDDLARSSTASTTPTPTRPSGPTSRSWSGSGRVDEVELRDGFPKTAEELYRYHAIVLDDLEAGFFTQDQLACCGTS